MMNWKLFDGHWLFSAWLWKQGEVIINIVTSFKNRIFQINVARENARTYQDYV